MLNRKKASDPNPRVILTEQQSSPAQRRDPTQNESNHNSQVEAELLKNEESMHQQYSTYLYENPNTNESGEQRWWLGGTIDVSGGQQPKPYLSAFNHH